jgi:hypothetical protein
MKTQIGGDHYEKHGKHEPFKVYESWFTAEEIRGYCKMSAIDYIMREGHKGGDEDLKKAISFLNYCLKATSTEGS